MDFKKRQHSIKGRFWLIGFGLIVVFILCFILVLVWYVDPFFHYHKPHTDKFFYALNNERSQNDGIVRHFDYDALITGTSMTENFRTSEVDEMFGTNCIKVSYSGGTFHETNSIIEKAFRYNPDIRLVIRSIDPVYIDYDADEMRDELGEYPEYLYDDNPFNDVEYVFNIDVIYRTLAAMTSYSTVGITSFDEYDRWQDNYVFGETRLILRTDDREREKAAPYTTDDYERIRENIETNLTGIADMHPSTRFLYFIPPYSIIHWYNELMDGNLDNYVNAERYAIELMLEHPNIEVYSYNTRYDIITDLDNYKDDTHYGDWINSNLLESMAQGDYQITRENYEDYISQEYKFYLNYDYEGLAETAE